MRKNIFYAFLAWLLPLVAMAQLEGGKVYSFENVQYSGKSMCLSTNSYIGINATNNSEYSQLWYAQAVDGAYTLRNLYSGQYLRSSNAQSVKWTMVNAVDDNCKFKCESAGSGYTLRASNTSNNYHYMHLAASQGNHLVGWEKGAAATQWKISEVNISKEDIERFTGELLNKTVQGISPRKFFFAKYIHPMLGEIHGEFVVNYIK